MRKILFTTMCLLCVTAQAQYLDPMAYFRGQREADDRNHQNQLYMLEMQRREAELQRAKVRSKSIQNEQWAPAAVEAPEIPSDLRFVFNDVEHDKTFHIYATKKTVVGEGAPAARFILTTGKMTSWSFASVDKLGVTAHCANRSQFLIAGDPNIQRATKGSIIELAINIACETVQKN